eukprot:m.88753 g.88753  ORF g.88753 m.88753 type:complete len:538 (-) comp14549_c1_seq4:1134-2747(-)
MPAKLVLSPSLTSSAGRFVLVGHQPDLSLAVRSSSALLSKIERVDGDMASTLCASALSSVNANASPYSGASTSVTLPVVGASSAFPFVRICMLATPQASSRFNSVVRPDVIARSCKSLIDVEGQSSKEAKGQGETDGDDGSNVVQIVYVLPNEEHPSASHSAMCLTFASALARSLPIYSRKGNKQETSSKVTAHVAFCKPSGEVYGDAELYGRIAHVCEGIRQCAVLVDAPCNEMHSTIFAKKALDLASSLPHVTAEEIVGEELAKRGLGGIYGVGKASVNPPRLVILKYTPEGATKTVAWCGKGIVYDTGGLSIKDKTGMPGMKRDMGGAAAVLHAFATAVKCGFKDNLYCLLAIAENSVGPEATRPDDIHVLYSGKTVEINNTDAEGRLVLGDAVAYAAKHFTPDVLVNMCTLTGAQGIATGQLHAGIVCSDEDLESKAVDAGRASGDLTHPLMWCPELFAHEFRSKVADMKNSVANRANAQVSCAAQFICNHLPEGFTDSHAWLHIDMAAPAHTEERSTGYGVALLSQLFVLQY